MKHCSILSLQVFERELIKASMKFQDACVPVMHIRGEESDGLHIRTHEIYLLMQSIGTPLDYRQICIALGLDLTGANLRYVHARLGSMLKSGWLEVCGRVRDAYFTRTQSASKQRSLLRLAAMPPQIVRAKAKLEARVDWLDQHFYQTRARFAAIATRLPVELRLKHPLDVRDRDILTQRAAGATLEEIGQAMTPPLTRERVRQLILKAQGTPVRRFPALTPG